ncbi:hypothetical protein PIB30_059249 [Stylosanthes scabra]|uniref:Retrotransposon gag domain-containing protein n=1 Tax=Stylosanthes scabra TaxID=79078 RepID=A0ABU6WMA3_9FABA|nr:hypothetical protein [Stylosanthes scabra]
MEEQFDQKFYFDGTENGYYWLITTEQFWNSQNTEEHQRFLQIEKLLKGKALAWFNLWKKRNPTANRSVFDLAFMHQFVPDSHPIMPEISWKLVSDLEIQQHPHKNSSTDVKEEEEVTDGFEHESAGDWSKLAGVVVLQRPPPEPPDLEPLVEITDAGRLRSLENDGGQDVGSRGAEYAKYGVIKGEKRRSTVTTLVNGATMVEGGSTSMMEEGGVALIVSSDSGHRCRRALPFIGNPLVLLAAVFPWTRDESSRTTRKEERALVHELVIAGDFAATTTARQREEAVVVL